jgi:hypothetical protein
LYTIALDGTGPCRSSLQLRLEHLQPFEAPGRNPTIVLFGLKINRVWVAIFFESAPRHSPISADKF